jgi:hypothetical protein
MNEVRNTATFHHPLLAIRNGQPVRILAIGDQEGRSPVYLTVDEQGRSQWQSVSEVKIIDFNVLPIGQDALRNLTQQQQQTQNR